MAYNIINAKTFAPANINRRDRILIRVNNEHDVRSSPAVIVFHVSGFGADFSPDTLLPASIFALLIVHLGLSVVWTGSMWLALGVDLVWNAIFDPSGAQQYLALQFSVLVIGLVLMVIARRFHVFGAFAPGEGYQSGDAARRD